MTDHLTKSSPSPLVKSTPLSVAEGLAVIRVVRERKRGVAQKPLTTQAQRLTPISTPNRTDVGCREVIWPSLRSTAEYPHILGGDPFQQEYLGQWDTSRCTKQREPTVPQGRFTVPSSHRLVSTYSFDSVISPDPAHMELKTSTSFPYH
jgi:hypothetical protein